MRLVQVLLQLVGGVEHPGALLCSSVGHPAPGPARRDRVLVPRLSIKEHFNRVATADWVHAANASAAQAKGGLKGTAGTPPSDRYATV